MAIPISYTFDGDGSDHELSTVSDFVSVLDTGPGCIINTVGFSTGKTGIAVNGTCAYRWDTATDTFDDDQSAQVQWEQTFNHDFGPGVRIGATGDGYYAVNQFSGSGNHVVLFKRVAGSNTTIATSTATFPGGGTPGTVRIEVVGTALEVFLDDVSIITATDAAIASGQPGLYSVNDTGDYANAIDNFVGDNLAGGAGSYTLNVDSQDRTLALQDVTLTYSSATDYTVNFVNGFQSAVIRLGIGEPAPVTFKDGHPCVRWSSNLKIVSASPADPGTGRYMHGIVRNPTHGNQGYDSSNAWGPTFDSSLDIARGIANGTPFDCPEPTAGDYDCYVFAESRSTGGANPDTQIIRMGFLYVYAQDRFDAMTDPADVISPPEGGPTHPADDVTYSALSLNLLGSGFNLLSGGGILTAHPFSASDFTTASGQMSDGYHDVHSDWLADNVHPDLQMGGTDGTPGRGYPGLWSGHVSMNCLALISTSRSEQHVMNVVRWGRQCHWNRVNGTTHSSDGGEGIGRQFASPIAGKLIGGTEGADMIAFADIASAADPRAVMGELGSIWRVLASDPARTLVHSYLATANGGLTAGVGEAEWGIRHHLTPAEDDALFAVDTGYRHYTLEYVYQTLLWRILGISGPTVDGEPWIDIMSDYVERYRTQAAALGSVNWQMPAQMSETWDALKDQSIGDTYSLDVASMALPVALQDVALTYSGTTYDLAVDSMGLTLALQPVLMQWSNIPTPSYELVVDSMTLPLRLGGVVLALNYSAGTAGGGAAVATASRPKAAFILNRIRRARR